MPIGETLKQYAIGAGIGLALYHFVLRPKLNLPALSDNINVRQMSQENENLRIQLNSTVQRLNSIQSSPVTPDVLERERRFGAMPSIFDDPRRYSSMPFEQHTERTNRERKYGFARSLGSKSIGAEFNMK